MERFVNFISSFWLWSVDAIISNGTFMNLFLTMSIGDGSCYESGL